MREPTHFLCLNDACMNASFPKPYKKNAWVGDYHPGNIPLKGYVAHVETVHGEEPQPVELVSNRCVHGSPIEDGYMHCCDAW